MSYLVVGEMTVDQAAYINVEYQYEFATFDSNNVIVFPYSSKIGYEIGSPLNMLYKDSAGAYYKIFNPFNLAYKKPDGTCRTSITD